MPVHPTHASYALAAECVACIILLRLSGVSSHQHRDLCPWFWMNVLVLDRMSFQMIGAAFAGPTQVVPDVTKLVAHHAHLKSSWARRWQELLSSQRPPSNELVAAVQALGLRLRVLATETQGSHAAPAQANVTSCTCPPGTPGAPGPERPSESSSPLTIRSGRLELQQWTPESIYSDTASIEW